MSTVDPAKKYVTLDGVRISYLPKNDTIHLTSTDPDVAAGGFHLTLGRGTQTEETLRDLLTESGLIGGGLGKADLGTLIRQPATRIEVSEIREANEKGETDWSGQPRQNPLIGDIKYGSGQSISIPTDGVMMQSTPLPHIYGGYVDPRAVNPDGNIVQSTQSKGGSGKTPVSFLSRRKRGLVLSVASAKGGVGKTATATMLGSMIAKTQLPNDRRLKVIVVDMDVQDPGLGLAVYKTQPTVLHYALAPEHGIDQAIAHEQELEIDLLLGSAARNSRAEKKEMLTPEFYGAVLQQLTEKYDVVILDTSVRYPDPYTDLAYKNADAILYVTDLGIGSVYGMTTWMAEQEEQFGDLEKVGVIVNRSMRDIGIDKDLLKKAARDAVLLGVIPFNTKLVHKAMNFARLDETMDSVNEVTAAVWNLVRRVISEDIMPRMTWQERSEQIRRTAGDTAAE